MPIQRLFVHEFGAFADANFEFSPGLNVFIGRNSTGKSHILKLLYAIWKSYERVPLAVSKEATLGEKLAGVFKPDDGRIGRLVRRRRGRNHADVELTRDGHGRISFQLSTLDLMKVSVRGWSMQGHSLFVPSREVLAMYEGFIGAYNKRESSFDETYYDLCLALNNSPLRKRSAEAKKLIQPLESAIGGSVSLIGPRFYVHQTSGKMEAHLVAEGLRKIGSLTRLIDNGSIAEHGLLFWDEPEANLNPHLIHEVATFLRASAKNGTQVFLASHDYLLTQYLSLAAESDPTLPISFFGFSRPKQRDPVAIETGRTLSKLAQNPILEEFARYYDRQREAFSETTSVEHEKEA